MVIALVRNIRMAADQLVSKGYGRSGQVQWWSNELINTIKVLRNLRKKFPRVIKKGDLNVGRSNSYLQSV